MAKTYFNEQQIKKWFVSEQPAKKVYHDEKLVFQSGFTLYITGSNHNVDDTWVWGHLVASGGQNDTNIKIIVNPGVELVAASTSVAGVFNFDANWAGRTIIIENNGLILGRGGTGGHPGGGSNGRGWPGGRGIYNPGNPASVSIDNRGTIAGGGGGGGMATVQYVNWGGGGGGAPFGAGGTLSCTVPGGNASLTSASGQPSKAGNGGSWGQPGVNGTGGYPGGAAGEATRGTITWINRGDIRGATV